MQKTILITGGAGYIGSHIALLLVQQGYQVIILDTLAHGQSWPHTWAPLIRADFGDKQILEHIFTTHSIHAVIHCAAVANINESLANPAYCYKNNVTSTLTLLETMLEHTIKKIIVASSCAVYGVPHQVPIVENHPRNPINPYGKSKLMVEYLLEDFNTAYGLNFIALRFFNAAGAVPAYNLGEFHEPETHVLPLLLRAAQWNKPFYIYGTTHSTPDGTCIRDFVHVWDIAHAHVVALKHLEHHKSSDFINVGTGQGVSISELIQVVERQYNRSIKKIALPPQIGDPAILVADPARAHNILNWKPQFSDLEYIVESARIYEMHYHQQRLTNLKALL